MRFLKMTLFMWALIPVCLFILVTVALDWVADKMIDCMDWLEGSDAELD